MHTHSLETIIEKETGYIGFCKGCQVFNVAYKNALFLLGTSELDAFSAMLHEQIGMQDFYTSHGKELFLRTPMTNFFLLFTHQEIAELCDMLNEAQLVLQARSLLVTQP